MTEIVTTLINRVSVAYIEIALPILFAAGVWVFSHIRTDKQGKRYWYSAKYESHKSQRKLDSITDGVNRSRTDLLRLQILQCIDHRPEEVETINALYTAYKKQPDSPNGYIDRRIEKWRKTNDI